jgi:hypothetical protein
VGRWGDAGLQHWFTGVYAGSQLGGAGLRSIQSPARKAVLSPLFGTRRGFLGYDSSTVQDYFGAAHHLKGFISVYFSAFWIGLLIDSHKAIAGNLTELIPVFDIFKWKCLHGSKIRLF